MGHRSSSIRAPRLPIDRLSPAGHDSYAARTRRRPSSPTRPGYGTGGCGASTGRRTPRYRPPHSSVNAAADDTDLPVLRATARQGLRTVLNDLDSEDWRRPGTAVKPQATTATP